MRVAIVMPLAEQRGGAEALLRQLMREGRGQGVDWHVVFLEDGPMAGELAELGIPTTVVAAGRLRQPLRYARAVARIRSIAKREGADVILGWMTKAHLYGGVAASLARVPSAWYQHGVPTGRSRLDRLATILPASGVIATSEAAATAQARLRPVRPRHVVHPGIDLGRFDPDGLPPPAEMRRSLGLPAEVPLVGFFGRLQRWKGAGVLVEAMVAVREELPGAVCVIVGGRHELEPDYPDYLRQLTAGRGLERNVVFAGFQPDVARWMHAVDVVALPSDNEPFGITVVEAMAMGKPVIAGDSGGPAETITSGENGLLVRHDDPAALATALIGCLRDPERSRRLAAAARMRALDFSAERYARDLIGVLLGLDAAPRR